ncbi:phage tail tape measure protein, TP901 family [Galbibacter orientalis DSM 19592]|uniref:Phage tail tape measure protein, TP901 family n=1 Tax=Galbibacter orientalis DSM 19592 TaxID=926559 RepID=I3C2C7_9FLAO|nr:phage tail tape measure protein [Galbibacter orientalis]EIJ37770.1 phage tail tape measure protein, TP901 family [Galbibacter orientalis DSM 19592]
MAIRGENSLYFKPEIDNSGLQQSANQAVNIVGQMASKITKINPFIAFSAVAVAALTAISKEAYDMAKSFESAMAEVSTIANVSEKEMRGLEQRLFDIYKRLGTEPPDKLAKGLYEIIGAGYDAAEALDVLEIASKAATAGITTTEVAADGLTTILNAFQLQTEDAQEVADVMFATVDRGKISFEELSSQIAQVAPIAAASNISFQEIGAAISTLTKQGVPAGQAMTQIRSAIVSTTEVMGDGVFETLSLQDAFNEMYKAADGSQTKLKEMAGRVEAVNGILSIAGPNMEGAVEDLNAMSDAAGSVDRSFSKVTGTNANQWSIFTNRIKASTQGIGESLLRFSNAVVGLMNDAIGSTEDLTDEVAKQASEYRNLIASLYDSNVEFDKKLEILTQLKNEYPEYLSSLDLDKVKNDNLKETLEGVRGVLEQIQNLKNKSVAVAGLQQQVSEAEATRNELDAIYQRELADFETLVGKALAFAEKNGIEIPISVNDDPDDIYSKIESAFSGVDGAYQDFVVPLFQAEKAVSTFYYQLEKAKDVVEENQISLDKFTVKLYDNAEGYKEIVKQVEKVNSLEGLAEFDEKFSFQGIKDAIEARKVVLTALGEIKDLTKEEYKANPNSLAKYLESENEQIKKAAEERKKVLEFVFKPTGDVGGKNTPNVSEVNTITNQKVNLEFDFTVDTTSINFIEATIRDLKAKFDAANENDRGQIREYLDIWKKKLKVAQNGYNDLEKLKKEFNYELRDLSLKELKEEKDKWKKTLDLYNDGSEESKKATELIMNQIDAISENTSDKIVEVFGQVTASIGEAQKLLETFGAPEGISEALGVLSELGTAAGNLFSGNPGQMVQGGLQALNAVFKSGISSDTGKFEKAIKDLNKTIEKLDYAISKSVGEDRIDNRISAIEKQKELQEELNEAIKAEGDARKDIKYLGITVANKGRGSGTDQAKLDALEKELEEAKRAVVEFQEELNELFTATTQTTIVDSIISGFKEGKKSAADFANDFKDLMQDAMLQAFEVKFLDDAIGGFYDEFAKAGSDSEYTPAEIASLRSLYNSIINGAQSDIEAINEVLEGLGMDGLGGQGTQKTGLSGAISTITEDTANILQGTLNAIRLDVASGISIATQNSQYLATISQGVTNYLPYLESIDGRMAGIESGLLQIQAQG